MKHAQSACAPHVQQSPGERPTSGANSIMGSTLPCSTLSLPSSCRASPMSVFQSRPTTSALHCPTRLSLPVPGPATQQPSLSWPPGHTSLCHILTLVMLSSVNP